MIRFEWEPTKAASNIRKHGVSFEEAQSVFYDTENSELAEDRFLLLGLSRESKMLMICHCERNSGDTIRLISARKATKKERKFYEGG